MATLRKHLDDMRWIFYERGMQHVYGYFEQLFDTTLDTAISISTQIGAIEVDSASGPFPAALETTVKPSGQQNLTQGSGLIFGATATERNPPTQFRNV